MNRFSVGYGNRATAQSESKLEADQVTQTEVLHLDCGSISPINGLTGSMLMSPKWLGLSRALIIVNCEVHIKTNNWSDAITPHFCCHEQPLESPFCVGSLSLRLNVGERGDRHRLSKMARIKEHYKKGIKRGIVDSDYSDRRKGHTLSLDRCKRQLDS